MIKEAYVSFETAKLLKEHGFNESTELVWYEHLPSQNAALNSEIGKPKRDYFYWEEVGERNSPWDNDSLVPSYISGEVYSCPTHQMAMAWLREVRDFSVEIFSIKGTSNVCPIFWKGNVVKLLTQDRVFNGELVGSYEEAVEAALKYTLENLI